VAERRLRDRGLATEVLYSEAPGHGVTLAREAASSGARVVAAVGGDGTIGEVLNGILLAETPAALGIVPAGTGNDTAKGLRIPIHDVPAAADLLADRPPRALDLLEVNSRPALGFGVIGFAADLGIAVNRWKSGPLRWVSQILRSQTYRVAAVHHLLFRQRPLMCRVRGTTLEGDELDMEGEIFTALAGNQPGVGGVFLPCPNAVGDDGLLDVCIVSARHDDGRRLTFIEKARTLRRAIFGQHVELPWVTYFQTDQPLLMEFESEEPVLADGDLLSLASRIELATRLKAIQVVC
jgi:diacylglycerol kinase (ATP)